MGSKILIIDDSKLELKIMTDILTNEGYEVYCFCDGSCILEKAHKIMPDVILLDIVMPGIDGFQVCALLKENSDLKDVPVIMLTAKTNNYDVKRAFDLGAFEYIKKPIDEIEVIARIQSAIRINEYQKKLKDLAMKDGLTGFYNHSMIIQLFENEYKRQENMDKYLSFIMMDIDYFKKVNDNYGHIFGDRVLKEISEIISNIVSEEDLVGRYGGEEFSIVSQGIDLEQLQSLCEDIRKSVEKKDFSNGNHKVKTTISIGAYFAKNRSLISTIDMIKNADEALYRAKNNGRNRIEIYSERLI